VPKRKGLLVKEKWKGNSTNEPRSKVVALGNRGPLVYRVESERILIVAIIHGKRLLENISERIEDNL